MAMLREVGDRSSPIWLLGDSDPKNWRDSLDVPFDGRHPARHNIWTPVIDIVQREVFVALGKRIDSDYFYIRNAVSDPNLKPSDPLTPVSDWPADARTALDEYRQLVVQFRPIIIFSFGWFGYVFGLRATNPDARIQVDSTESHTAHLGKEFFREVQSFDASRVNLLPLLHATIARNHFLSAHRDFCDSDGANYFEKVGRSIAGILVQHHTIFHCWLGGPNDKDRMA